MSPLSQNPVVFFTKPVALFHLSDVRKAYKSNTNMRHIPKYESVVEDGGLLGEKLHVHGVNL